MKSHLLKLHDDVHLAAKLAAADAGVSLAEWLRRAVHAAAGCAPPPPVNRGGRPSGAPGRVPTHTFNDLCEKMEAALLSLSERNFDIAEATAALGVPLYRARHMVRRWAAEGHVAEDGRFSDKRKCYQLAHDWPMHTRDAPCAACKHKEDPTCHHWYL